MVHEPLSHKLVAFWQHAQAQINLAGKTRPPAEAESETTSALAAYRKNVTTALLARASSAEDCFVVQYVHSATPAPADAALHSGLASFSVRFVGRPVLDESKTVVRSFEYAESLPGFISRTVPSTRDDSMPLTVLGEGETEVEVVPPPTAPVVTAALPK
jgi:hypothetical protein